MHDIVMELMKQKIQKRHSKMRRTATCHSPLAEKDTGVLALLLLLLLLLPVLP
jgi:hypothetical protein